MPGGWDVPIMTMIRAAKAQHAQHAQIDWVDPTNAPFDQLGLLREGYYPGDIGFDPLGLRLEYLEELDLMIAKELQNGQMAMLASSRFLA